jgi:tRNA(Ile2) C34 agmatinyltransferase TiaS
MEKEVYLVCANCGGITNGIGSGENPDYILCKKCKTRIKAERLCYCEIKTKRKALYIPENFILDDEPTDD